MRNYYEAYDDRYRQVHSQGLQWSQDRPSPIVEEILKTRFGDRQPRILEIGCGEGRDARYLLKRGWQLLATDISPEAVAYCQSRDPAHKAQYEVLDCLSGNLDTQFDFIYAVAVLHMLVEDADRQRFYRFLKKHLSANGLALVCSMGDGELERRTDPREAFELRPRMHEQTGRELQIAATTCRIVTDEQFAGEILDGGLAIVETGTTDSVPGFPFMMYALVCK